MELSHWYGPYYCEQRRMRLERALALAPRSTCREGPVARSRCPCVATFARPQKVDEIRIVDEGGADAYLLRKLALQRHAPNEDFQGSQ